MKENNIKENFFSQLNVSSRTYINYEKALRSTFLKQILWEHFKKEDLFSITDKVEIWNFYCIVNLHPTNIQNHRIYSSAVMKYLRFLNNGEKYGKRRDFKQPRRFKRHSL